VPDERCERSQDIGDVDRCCEGCAQRERNVVGANGGAGVVNATDSGIDADTSAT
jgi:hypothetical protein